MEITNSPLEWTSDDMANWQAFLRTQTGSRLFPKALEQAPVLLESGETNSILIRNGKVTGFQDLIRVLLSLSTSEPLPATHPEAYPPLEKDDEWEDGQKLTKTPEPTE